MATDFTCRGPWESEPNVLDWTDERTGLRCHILRVRDSGHLCGYVEVPAGHPLHGIDCSDTLPESLTAAMEAVKNGPIGKRGVMDLLCMAMGGEVRAGYLFDVHGGVTYSGVAYWADQSGHWYGFDCAHCDDYCPSRRFNTGLDSPHQYRDMEYVKAECAALAKQIQEFAEGVSA